MILESNVVPPSAEIIPGHIFIQKEQPKSYNKVQVVLMTQIENQHPGVLCKHSPILDDFS